MFSKIRKRLLTICNFKKNALIPLALSGPQGSGTVCGWTVNSDSSDGCWSIAMNEVVMACPGCDGGAAAGRQTRCVVLLWLVDW